MRLIHIVTIIISMLLLTQVTALHANGYRGYIGSLDPVLQKQVQEALREKGYDPGLIDGKFGPITEGALAKYQADNGLAVNSYMTPSLAKSLLSIELPEDGGIDFSLEEELNLLRQLGLVPTKSYWEIRGHVFPD